MMRTAFMVNEQEIAGNNQQMELPLEFVPVVNGETDEDRLAICRWEGEGGSVGREEE